MEALAKYFPIEGEIKEGDWFLSKNGELNQLVPENKYWWGYSNYGKYKMVENGGHLKVRLFAVTQDVEAGDEIRITYPNGNIVERRVKNIEGQAVYCIDVEPPFPKSDCYKILCELSSHATWMEDGDKIEGQQEWYCRIHRHTDPLCNCLEKENGNAYLVFEVICPTCNTQH